MIESIIVPKGKILYDLVQEWESGNQFQWHLYLKKKKQEFTFFFQKPLNIHVKYLQ